MWHHAYSDNVIVQEASTVADATSTLTGQYPADWPDPVLTTQTFQKRHYLFQWRSISAWAKYT
ncbi:hypothetical protein BSPA111_07920 [Buttiauxella sp. A111]|nr:hypothetical protein BSPA111_07920 [Buttiauxella sp. A111]